MSWISQVTTNFRIGFGRTRRNRRDIDELRAEIAALRQQLGQLAGGSAHHPGLNLDPPMVWLMITQVSDVGASGRRLNPVKWGSTEYTEYAGHTVFELDEDDTVEYLIDIDATMPLFFVGARVLCIHTRLFPQGDYPARGLYYPIAGEVFGFWVQLGEADGSDRYPWKQVSPVPTSVPYPRLYTDESEPLGMGTGALGKAEPIEREAYDPAITLRHRAYENRKVFLSQKAPPLEGGWFQFHGYEEPEYLVCP